MYSPGGAGLPTDYYEETSLLKAGENQDYFLKFPFRSFTVIKVGVLWSSRKLLLVRSVWGKRIETT